VAKKSTLVTLFIRGKVKGILSIVNNVLSGFSSVEGNHSNKRPFSLPIEEKQLKSNK